MGLDMYLLPKEKNKSIQEILDNFNEVAYWRKANAIHRYFCKVGKPIEEEVIYIIDRTVLIKLIHLCIDVLFGKVKAEESLPTQDGFFFGSIEYDDWYFEDVKNTIDILINVLQTNEDDKFIYYASW